MKKKHRAVAVLLALSLILLMPLPAAAEGDLPLLISPAPGQSVTAAPTFSDVAEDAWYAPYVAELAGRGAMDGYPDGTFRPAEVVTRAQAVKLLYALSGSTPVNYPLPFPDVAEEQWYTEAVRWAAAQGIVTGNTEGAFQPDAPLTRQDLAVLLVRFARSQGLPLSQEAAAPAFADNADIAPYAAEAVYLLQKAGAVAGIDGSFYPRAAATRAQLCKLLSVLTA